jgi:hypothetical protein
MDKSVASERSAHLTLVKVQRMKPGRITTVSLYVSRELPHVLHCTRGLKRRLRLPPLVVPLWRASLGERLILDGRSGLLYALQRLVQKQPCFSYCSKIGPQKIGHSIIVSS